MLAKSNPITPIRHWTGLLPAPSCRLGDEHILALLELTGEQQHIRQHMKRPAHGRLQWQHSLTAATTAWCR